MEHQVSKGKFLKMTVTFLGANDGRVTGSSTLVTIERRSVITNILVDHGSYQGEDEELNLDREIPIPMEELDYILVTHPHADHIGNVPALYKKGCNATVHASTETLNEGAEIVRDCAILNGQRMRFRMSELKKMDKLLERELSRALKKEASRKEIAAIMASQEEVEEERAMVPYLWEDAEKAIQHFVPCEVKQDCVLREGIHIKLIPNSHVNGATLIEIYATHGEERCSIAFSGDIGRDSHPLYKEMVYDEEPNIDFLVLESLHGFAEEEETYEDAYNEIAKWVRKGIRAKKKVYIVTFALDRSTLIASMLNKLGVAFLFDTPLGEKQHSWYIRSYKTQKSEWFDYTQPYPFDVEHVRFARDHEEHMTFVKRDGPVVAITSSGMGFGGRVLDYFVNHIQDKDAIFIFPEFLPEGCPSKILCDAEKGDLIEIHGEHYKKHCTTVQVNGCSGHGYRKEKLKLVNRYSNAKVIYLNHGDEASIQQLWEELPNHTRAKVLVPSGNSTYDLTQILSEIE